MAIKAARVKKYNPSDSIESVDEIILHDNSWFVCCYDYYEEGDLVLVFDNGTQLSPSLIRNLFIPKGFYRDDYKATSTFVVKKEHLFPTFVMDPETQSIISEENFDFDYSPLII